jgi:hypothetical protein
MFLSAAQVAASLQLIEPIHQFFGTSFLAFKSVELPIGSKVVLQIAKLEKQILDAYYQPCPDSDFYYVPLRGNARKDRWVRKGGYQNSSLQRIRADTFVDALLHQKGLEQWGWRPEYVKALLGHLHNHLISAFDLAVWLFRERAWPDGTRPENIINAFYSEFHITDAERVLFDDVLQQPLMVPDIFVPQPISKSELQAIIGPPPDALPDSEGMLRVLELRGVGPAKYLQFEPSERLNIITGDNGLGKTFLLECVWWALSGDWVELAAYPRQDSVRPVPRITFQVSGRSSKREIKTIDYNWETQSWSSQQNPSGAGLLLYARVDGSFGVWDPAKTFNVRADAWRKSPASTHSLIFSREQVWDGIASEGPSGKINYLCNGLLRDWITWQNKPDKYPFEVFKSVMGHLSPPELGKLEIGDSARISTDVREIPTLRLPYGQVPIVHISAGMRRIITLAYLIVWAWEEHRIASELSHREPQKRMVIIVDEMEAHLHPQWQRSIVPALFDVIKLLSPGLKVQLFIGTHSPLVMASIEPFFDDDLDRLFNLKLEGQTVSLEILPYTRYGPVDAWLTSEVFGLTTARSLQAESAITAAKDLQRQSKATKDS